MRLVYVREVESLCVEVAKLCRALDVLVQKAEAAPVDAGCRINGPYPEQAALRRRSLDLTRALARMRSPL